jgi:pimeloyl-ACP methyl ester carboxylesterase
VVFVANGAGDFRALSQNVSRVVNGTGTPLEIKTVDWSVGYRRYVADQVDGANHLVQGRRLAAEVAAYRASYPDRRIYFLGHSAGCAVLLVAAESLPPDSVDRMILLAPSVCANHDLRPALRACRCGIDSYHSSGDRWVLGLGVRIVGTGEGNCRSAAGLNGFTLAPGPAGDAALYSRLRQHAWDPAVEWAGHDGGHFGTSQTAFLRAYVLPLLSGN